MIAAVLAAVAALAALVNWRATWTSDQRLDWWSKPVVTAALLAIAAVAPRVHGGGRPWWVVALVGCLLGDVLLMLPRDRFVAGLVAFLVGHVAFIVGFTQIDVDHSGATVRIVLGALLVVGVLALVAPRVLRAARQAEPALFLPVVAYMVIISAMVVVAAVRAGWWGLAGAAFFYASDALLAWDRFVRVLRRLALAVMVTYHAALAGLVLALLR